MIYRISFDSRTRIIAFKDIDSISQGDIRFNQISVIKSDSDRLLEGYEMYCVFDDGTKIKFVDDVITVPDFSNRRSIFIQLCFEKNDSKFYSLNTLMLKVNKAIL